MNAKKLSVLLVSIVMIVAVASLAFTPKEADAAAVAYNNSLLWETGNANNGYDVYALEIAAGQSVTLNMLCHAADFDPLIEIYQNGSLVASDDDSYPAGADNPCGLSAQLVFTPATAGGYTVRATSADFASGTDSGYGSGGYTIAADGNFTSFGPTAENVPHLGLVLIRWGESQPAYVSPGGNQVIAGSNGADIILPADADGSGYDTYIVTGAANVGGETWVSVWLGGAAYGWVPLDSVTPVTALNLPVFPTASATARATSTRPAGTASPSATTTTPSATATTQTPAATTTQ